MDIECMEEDEKSQKSAERLPSYLTNVRRLKKLMLVMMDDLEQSVKSPLVIKTGDKKEPEAVRAGQLKQLQALLELVVRFKEVGAKRASPKKKEESALDDVDLALIESYLVRVKDTQK